MYKLIKINADRRRNDIGFTLLELMIVIAVIGILAIAGVPKFQAVKTNYHLEGSAQTVISELKYAKQLAMDQRKTTYVVFTHSGINVVQNITGSYQILDTKPLDFGVTFDPNQATNAWLPQVSSQGAALGWGLSYNYQGFPSSSGTVLVSHSSGKEVGINIAKQTGYLSIIWP